MKALPSSCTAAVFHGAGQPLELEQIELPRSLGPGEVLVEVECCTICGSDLHTTSGKRIEPTPCILGHEIVGRVAECESNRTDVSVGDRVVWSVIVGCPDAATACEMCKRGIPQKCSTLRKFGHAAIEPAWSLSGGLSEYVHLPRGSHIVPVRENPKSGASLPSQLASISSCAVATVMAAVRATRQLRDRSVLITGAGMLGLTAAAVGQNAGCCSIVVCDPDPSRREVAKRFGATQCLTPEELADATGTFDIVFEMSGSVAAVAAGLGMLAVGGDLLLVGSVAPSAPLEVPPERLVRGVNRLIGVHNYATVDLEAAVAFLQSNHTRFPFAELVSPPFALADVESAFSLAATGQYARVAIRPGQE